MFSLPLFQFSLCIIHIHLHTHNFEAQVLFLSGVELVVCNKRTPVPIKETEQDILVLFR